VTRQADPPLPPRPRPAAGTPGAVQLVAPLLMAGYRSPFTGASGADNPFISGGFVLTNSGTDCGACALAPRMIAQVCRNGEPSWFV
jgi:hypothetical protein